MNIWQQWLNNSGTSEGVHKSWESRKRGGRSFMSALTKYQMGIQDTKKAVESHAKPLKDQSQGLKDLHDYDKRNPGIMAEEV